MDQTKTLHAVIGADGQIGKLLVNELLADGKRVVAIGRAWKGQPFGDAVEYRVADAADQASLEGALAGCAVAYSTIGLPYSAKLWSQMWPVITRSLLGAVQGQGCKLVVLDNVYSYGLVRGTMTEQTPLNPCSKKGIARAESVRQLQQAMQDGKSQVIIARSADFIGPGAASSIIGQRFFDGIVHSSAPVRKAEWLGNPATRHTYTFTLDIARGLAQLGNAADAQWNQTWHLPSNPPITGFDLCGLISMQAHCTIKPRPVHTWQLRLGGLFTPLARESAEMQYQVEHDYIFSDAKFMAAFPTFKKTGWNETIAQTLAYFA